MKEINLSYKDFKEKIHKPFYEHWLTEFVFRPISNLLAYLIIKYTNVKANQITLMSLFMIFFGTILFLYGIYTSNLLLIIFGSLCFILFHLLDVLDGDVARARAKILLEEYTLNGSHLDALIHQYYNFLFFSSYGYLLSVVLNNYIFLILGIVAGFLLIVNDIIFSYKEVIKLGKKLNIREINYRNFKNKSQKKFSFKDIMLSFVGMMGFSIIIFVLSIISFYLNNYFVLAGFFILLVLSTIIIHIKTFIDFYKFEKPKKIVITYGTFDLLHYGHLELLRRAKELGNYLIVGLSTDEFNKLKGKQSYFSYKIRKKMIEELSYVNKVIPEVNWEQKIEDIKKYKVDVFVIGNDWKGKFDYLKDYGVEVIYLPRTEGVSTTKIKRDLKLN